MEAFCVKCRVDSRACLCKCCGRLADEIANWSKMSDEQREAVVAQLEERKKKAAVAQW